MAYHIALRENEIVMKEFSTVQERDAFNERIFEIVQEYLEDSTLESNFGLSINPKTLELALVSHENNPEGCDFHPIDGLIRPNENNTGNEPDCDATHKLASSYCFVR